VIVADKWSESLPELDKDPAYNENVSVAASHFFVPKIREKYSYARHFAGQLTVSFDPVTYVLYEMSFRKNLSKNVDSGTMVTKLEAIALQDHESNVTCEFISYGNHCCSARAIKNACRECEEFGLHFRVCVIHSDHEGGFNSSFHGPHVSSFARLKWRQCVNKCNDVAAKQRLENHLGSEKIELDEICGDQFEDVFGRGTKTKKGRKN
jgi:hypothetical protein